MLFVAAKILQKVILDTPLNLGISHRGGTGQHGEERIGPGANSSSISRSIGSRRLRQVGIDNVLHLELIGQLAAQKPEMHVDVTTGELWSKFIVIIAANEQTKQNKNRVHEKGDKSERGLAFLEEKRTKRRARELLTFRLEHRSRAGNRE